MTRSHLMPLLVGLLLIATLPTLDAAPVSKVLEDFEAGLTGWPA